MLTLILLFILSISISKGAFTLKLLEVPFVGLIRVPNLNLYITLKDALLQHKLKVK